MKKDITNLYCFVDDFVQGIKQESPCRNFKYFDQPYLQLYCEEFPKLIGYERFVALMPGVLCLLLLLLFALLVPDSGIGYIDLKKIGHRNSIRLSQE